MEYSDPEIIVNSFSQVFLDPTRVSATKILQAQLDTVADRLRLHYDGLGTPLIYHLGHWRTFRHAAWRPLERSGLRELSAVVARLAESIGLTSKADLAMIHRGLRANLLFAPPGWKPFSRNVVLNVGVVA